MTALSKTGWRISFNCIGTRNSDFIAKGSQVYSNKISEIEQMHLSNIYERKISEK